MDLSLLSTQPVPSRGTLRPRIEGSMPAVREESARQLIVRVTEAMGVSGTELARLHGVSTKTVGRWLRGETSPDWVSIGDLAPLVYPYDAELAVRMRDRSVRECTKAGVPLPPPLPIPVPTPTVDAAAAPFPEKPAKPTFVAPPQARVAALVCAACDAIDVSPRTLRPALLAAFRAARDLELTLDEVEQHLSPPAKRKPMKEI